MNYLKPTTCLLLMLLFSAITIACSSGKSPVEPSAQMPDEFGAVSDTGRSIIGMYQAEINPDDCTFTIEPIDRIGAYHIPLSDYYDVLSITGYGWTPNFWADIKLTHPFPDSGIDGFDPRVIAVLPARDGVSMNYPVLDVLANNSVLLEPDGYTKLFDKAELEGNTNPFVAYFKGEPNRVWASTGNTQETKRWEMDINGFGGSFAFYFVVDVSTNFPNPPQPGVDNAPEPVQICTTVGDGLTPGGGSATIDVTVTDWQGFVEIGGVFVEAPDLFNGTVSLAWVPGPGTIEFDFTGDISNEKHAPVGDYNILVASYDDPTGIYIYDEFTVTVAEEAAFNLEDVTPPGLNVGAIKLDIVGNYGYVIAANNGMHIFDISDPITIQWIAHVDLDEMMTHDIQVARGYAYVCNYYNGLKIIDIDPPESAHVVHTVDFVSYPLCIHIPTPTSSNAYAGGPDKLDVIDISNPESAFIRKSIDIPGDVYDVDATGFYAHCVGTDAKLWVVDTSYETIIGTLTLPYDATSITRKGDYVDFIGTGANVCIVKIVHYTPWFNASITKTINTTEGVKDLAMTDNFRYLYAADGSAGLSIIDIYPIDDSFVAKTVDAIYYTRGVDFTSGYAFMADDVGGLHTVDIDPVDDAHIVSTYETLVGSNGVYISDGYAYITNTSLMPGFKIVDIDPLEDAHIVETFYPEYSPESVFVLDGYAYVPSGSAGLVILDIDPPESTHSVCVVDTQYFANSVYVIGDYAYVADGDFGLVVINIKPPETAYIVDQIGGFYDAKDIDISGDYAYMADSCEGLKIVERTPVSIVKEVDTEQAYGVDYDNGYVYVADYSFGVKIIDVAPIENASVVKSISPPGQAFDICYSDGHAFTASNWHGLQVIDVSPIETADVVDALDISGQVRDVTVIGDYAYLSQENSGYGGLVIVKLR